MNYGDWEKIAGLLWEKGSKGKTLYLYYKGLKIFIVELKVNHKLATSKILISFHYTIDNHDLGPEYYEPVNDLLWDDCYSDLSFYPANSVKYMYE